MSASDSSLPLRMTEASIEGQEVQHIPLTGFAPCGRTSPLACGGLCKRKQERQLEQARLPFHGERGIRTPGTVIPYGSLANCWFQPLTHLTLTEIVLPAIADRPGPRKQDDKVKSNLDICQINFNDCRLS